MTKKTGKKHAKHSKAEHKIIKKSPEKAKKTETEIKEKEPKKELKHHDIDGIVIKITSVFLTVVLIANFYLFFLKKITNLYFWIIIALIAVVAYKVIPNIKKQK